MDFRKFLQPSKAEKGLFYIRVEQTIKNPERRAVLQAELDAIFAHLYGLNTEDLRYILDPEDICGKGCINETFRMLKDNGLRQYGEYRTKRLVLGLE